MPNPVTIHPRMSRILWAWLVIALILAAFGLLLFGLSYFDKPRSESVPETPAPDASTPPADQADDTEIPDQVDVADEDEVGELFEQAGELLGTCEGAGFEVSFDPVLQMYSNGYTELTVSVAGPALAEAEPVIELAGDSAVLAVALVSVSQAGSGTWSMQIDHAEPLPLGGHLMFVDVTVADDTCTSPLALEVIEYLPEDG